MKALIIIYCILGVLWGILAAHMQNKFLRSTYLILFLAFITNAILWPVSFICGYKNGSLKKAEKEIKRIFS